MTLSVILNVLFAIGCGVLTALYVYKSTGQNLAKKVVLFIDEANKLDLLGPEKMEVVVNKLYNLIPITFRDKLTKEILKEEAQKVYDAMKDFSESEANKK